jgi:hypothetical protein
MAALQNKYYTTEKNYEKKNLNSDGQQSHQYQISNVVFFMFNILRQEVGVRFVDIDGIVDHHCLNFSFHNFSLWCSIYFVMQPFE